MVYSQIAAKNTVDDKYYNANLLVERIIPGLTGISVLYVNNPPEFKIINLVSSYKPIMYYFYY